MAHVCAGKHFGALRLARNCLISIYEPPPCEFLEWAAYDFWRIFASRVLSSGPFAEVYKLRKLDDIVPNLYYYYFPPTCPPMRGRPWNVGAGNSERKDEISECLRELCGRRCPIAISSRWYSVGRFCFHFPPLIIFGLLPKYLIYVGNSMLYVTHLDGCGLIQISGSFNFGC